MLCPTQHSHAPWARAPRLWWGQVSIGLLWIEMQWVKEKKNPGGAVLLVPRATISLCVSKTNFSSETNKVYLDLDLQVVAGSQRRPSCTICTSCRHGWRQRDGCEGPVGGWAGPTPASTLAAWYSKWSIYQSLSRLLLLSVYCRPINIVIMFHFRRETASMKPPILAYSRA